MVMGDGETGLLRGSYRETELKESFNSLYLSFTPTQGARTRNRKRTRRKPAYQVAARILPISDPAMFSTVNFVLWNCILYS